MYVDCLQRVAMSSFIFFRRFRLQEIIKYYQRLLLAARDRSSLPGFPLFEKCVSEGIPNTARAVLASIKRVSTEQTAGQELAFFSS